MIESSNTTAGIAKWYGRKMLTSPENEHGIGRGRKAYDPTRPNPQKKQGIKSDRSENNPRHKKPKVHGRTYRSISRSQQMYEQQTKKVKARVRPRNHQLVPNQYRKWWVMD